MVETAADCCARPEERGGREECGMGLAGIEGPCFMPRRADSTSSSDTLGVTVSGLGTGMLLLGIPPLTKTPGPLIEMRREADWALAAREWAKISRAVGEGVLPAPGVTALARRRRRLAEL